MDSSDVALGIAAVVPLVQLCKYSGVPKQWAPAAVAVLSLVVTVLLIYQDGGVVQSRALSYFMGWVSILTGASGVYGFAAAAFPEQTPVATVGQPKPKPKPKVP